MKYQTVLFDLDGTLLDTSSGIFKCIHLTAEEMGLGEITDLYRFIGPPLEDSARNFLSLNERDISYFVETYRRFYATGHMFEAYPYDGIIDLLNTLIESGITLGVITNKNHLFAVDIIKHFEFEKYFNIVRGAAFGKTKADLIRACVKEINNDFNRTIYVGDTPSDKQAAKDANVSFAGVTWGFGYKKGDILFDTPQALSQFLINNRDNHL